MKPMLFPRRWRLAFGAASALVGLGAVGFGAWVATPPAAHRLAPPDVPSLTIEDRHGRVLRTTRAGDGTRSRWVPLPSMDADVLAAFIAVEDRRFLEHRGIDIHAVARAARDNLRAGQVVSGASTITMQLARLISPARRSWAGKAQQAAWALRLETHLSKQAILEQYLNRIPLGQGTVGVDAAAALYFDASARRLSLGQAAMLAGVARAPSRDNPMSSVGRATARRAAALDQLGRSGYASAEEVRRAMTEAPMARERAAPFDAPHFTSRLLAHASGQAGGARSTWRSGLDLELQRSIEREVRDAVTSLHDRGARHAAAVVLSNATGEILAWVGSPDFWAETSGQTDMVVSRRQPGSALKPFLYGLAFDRGATPATAIADVPRTYRTPNGSYNPRNYDREFRGPVLAREALASSYNVPAVSLAEGVGASSLLQTLHAAGFASLAASPEHYGLGLALGNGDVTLLEVANGYRALANGGVWSPVSWTFHDAPPPGERRRVMSARSAALVLDILSDPVARIPGFGVQTPFDLHFPVAVKTGTSRHFTDNWAVGTTGGFTVAVWVGNFSGRPMEGVSGVSGAGPLLHRALVLTAARHAPGALPSPASVGARRIRICRLSGLLATHDCPHADEWIPADHPLPRECDWHRDGQVVLPPEYAEWRASRGGFTGIASGAPHHVPPAPDAAAPPRGDEDANAFRIVSPKDGDSYAVPPGVDSRYSTIGLVAAGSSPVRWTVDGRRVDAARLRLTPGTHIIQAADAAGRRDEVTIRVK